MFKLETVRFIDGDQGIFEKALNLYHIVMLALRSHWMAQY